MPSWVTKDAGADVVDEFVGQVYGMGLAILIMRMQREQGTAIRGQAGLLLPDAPRPGRGHSYPWGELVGPLPQPTAGKRQLRLTPGLPWGWNWDQCLVADILTWARELQWVMGELALDCELTVHRALPTGRVLVLRFVVPPLQERAAVLRQAIRALKPHMLAG